jgi:cytoskeletal protein RodZ
MFEIGNTLREARLRRGLDILDCEAETKIRAKYLRAMEEEQFDLMPSPTYVRGFLRTYSEFLDLDGQLVLDEYESRFGTYDPPFESGSRSARTARAPRHPPGGEARSAPSPRRGRPPRRRRTELQLLWLAIGGVMAVAIVIWLGVGESDSTAPLPEAPAASNEGAATPAAPVPEPDTAAEEGPVRVKKTPIVLTGTGTIGSWVEVRSRNANGRKVFEAILTPGEAKSFRVVEGIWIRAANPAELQVTVAGKEAELGSSATGNWIITPDGAKSVG